MFASALGLVAALAILLSAGVAADIRLVADGSETVGLVRAVESGNHETIRYEYTVDDTTYAGAGRVPSALPGEVGVGRPIKVRYVRSDARISTLGNPADETVTTGGLAILVGLGISFVIARRMRHVFERRS